jgi:hypothetical protein
MNYQKVYNQIIERAKTRQLKGYTEKHHIIPKCLGGNNDKKNLVELTAREHFICHRLLCELYPDNEKLKYCLWLMITGRKRWKFADDYNISSKVYENTKLTFSELMKTKKTNLGNKHSDETKQKMSQSHLGKKRTEETKQKMKTSALGKKKTEQHKKSLSESTSNSFGRPVLQKDLYDNLVKEWKTGKLASQELNLNYLAINNCCRKNENNNDRKRDKNNIGKYTSSNYIWEYKK